MCVLLCVCVCNMCVLMCIYSGKSSGKIKLQLYFWKCFFNVSLLAYIKESVVHEREQPTLVHLQETMPPGPPHSFCQVGTK